MSYNKIVKLLDQLSAVATDRADTAAEAIEEKEHLLTNAQIEEIAEIDKRVEAVKKGLDREEKSVRSQIKELTLELGEKVIAGSFQAIPTTRTRWNGKGLDGYAVANPDILAFRSETKSVTIRKA